MPEYDDDGVSEASTEGRAEKKDGEDAATSARDDDGKAKKAAAAAKARPTGGGEGDGGGAEPGRRGGWAVRERRGASERARRPWRRGTDIAEGGRG